MAVGEGSLEDDATEETIASEGKSGGGVRERDEDITGDEEEERRMGDVAIGGR